MLFVFQGAGDSSGRHHVVQAPLPLLHYRTVPPADPETGRVQAGGKPVREGGGAGGGLGAFRFSKGLRDEVDTVLDLSFFL